MANKLTQNFKAQLSAFLVGIIFGTGLIISGLTNPSKVLAFLDIFGVWDPSLALVMAGAISVGLVAFHFAKRLKKSFLGEPIKLPIEKIIDNQLIAGSVIFGIGWGLVGICPGPSLVLLGNSDDKAFVFVSSVITGFVLYEIIQLNFFKKK